MFARIFALVPFVLLASASHLEARDGAKCNTGDVRCCNQASYNGAVQKFTEKGVLAAIDLGAGALLGVTCSPIAGVGVGGNSCTQQTVCCNNNNFNGVVAIGCTPINVNV